MYKVSKAVTPAKAGVHKWLSSLDSRFRGNDENGCFLSFYEFIKYQPSKGAFFKGLGD